MTGRFGWSQVVVVVGGLGSQAVATAREVHTLGDWLLSWPVPLHRFSPIFPTWPGSNRPRNTQTMAMALDFAFFPRPIRTGGKWEFLVHVWRWIGWSKFALFPKFIEKCCICFWFMVKKFKSSSFPQRLRKVFEAIWRKFRLLSQSQVTFDGRKPTRYNLKGKIAHQTNNNKGEINLILVGDTENVLENISLLNCWNQLENATTGLLRWWRRNSSFSPSRKIRVRCHGGLEFRLNLVNFVSGGHQRGVEPAELNWLAERQKGAGVETGSVGKTFRWVSLGLLCVGGH